MYYGLDLRLFWRLRFSGKYYLGFYVFRKLDKVSKELVVFLELVYIL